MVVTDGGSMTGSVTIPIWSLVLTQKHSRPHTSAQSPPCLRYNINYNKK